MRTLINLMIDDLEFQIHVLRKVSEIPISMSDVVCFGVVVGLIIFVWCGVRR